MLNTVRYPQGQSAFGRRLDSVSGKTILLTIVLCILSVQISQAQWQPDVRLTNDPALSNTSSNNAWCIAASPLGVVHAVWFDLRDNNAEIYYKRSPDGGLSWGADIRLTNNSSNSRSPSVVTHTIFNNTHVVWADDRDGNLEIYYKRSLDGGATWGADTRLTDNPSSSNFPSVSISGLNIHVLWEDDRNGNKEIYYKRSSNSGNTWEADTRLTNNSASSNLPSVSVSDLAVHVVWYDTRDGNNEIYYKRSPDGGISWGADTRLTNNAAFSFRSSVSVSGSVVHVVWQDNRDGGTDEIFYKRSTDAGISWGADTRLTNNSASSNLPSVSISGSATVHVVWSDDRDGNTEIYTKRSQDEGISWGADTRLTNNSGLSGYPSIALSGTVVHVVWQDNRDGNYEIYYKRDPTGNPIGIININSEIPEEYSLSQNYPNPFNPSTNIKFEIPLAPSGKSSNVKLIVYDLLGKEVSVLVNEELKVGTYQYDWDASNYPSGVYFYRLFTKDFSESKRMMLVK